MSLETAWSGWQWDERYRRYYCYRLDASGLREDRWSEPHAAEPRSQVETQISDQDQSVQQPHSPVETNYHTATTLGGYGSASTPAYTPTSPWHYNHAQPSILTPQVDVGYFAQPDATSQMQNAGNWTQAQQPHLSPQAYPNYFTQQNVASSLQQPSALQATPLRNSNTQLSSPPNALDAAYQVVPPRRLREFFVPGRVFATLWVEPGSGSASSSTMFTVVRFGEQAFAEIRRFVVMKATSHHSTCVPIATYGNQGVVRRHDAKDHAIAYTSASAPTALPGERLEKRPIRIELSTSAQEDELKPTSRINFSQAFTVQHNLKVKKLGHVAAADLSWARRYWKGCMNES